MLKKILLFTALVTFVTASVCFASIRLEQTELGCIRVGETRDFVESIYGEPDSSKVNHMWGGMNCRYGDSFDVTYTMDGHVIHISTTADNGIVTADGIKIGSTINDIMRVYGEPKNSVRDRITNRFNMFFYNVEGERRIGIRFDFDLEGYVTKIGSGYFD